jgi:predicted nucleic acid-binding Zn ribbon protein
MSKAATAEEQPDSTSAASLAQGALALRLREAQPPLESSEIDPRIAAMSSVPLGEQTASKKAEDEESLLALRAVRLLKDATAMLADEAVSPDQKTRLLNTLESALYKPAKSKATTLWSDIHGSSRSGSRIGTGQYKTELQKALLGPDAEDSDQEDQLQEILSPLTEGFEAARDKVLDDAGGTLLAMRILDDGADSQELLVQAAEQAKVVDPDEDFTTQLGGMFELRTAKFVRRFTKGGPLLCAILRNKHEWVENLLQAKANVNANYAYQAGARKVTWEGPLVHAAVYTGDEKMLELLANRGAELTARATKDTGEQSLLWMAAYSGQESLVRYLLKSKSFVNHRVPIDGQLDIDEKGKDLDDDTMYTPMHIACIRGFQSIVSHLMIAKAAIDGDNDPALDTVRLPVDDAIRYGHHEIVKLLTKRGADVFRRYKSAEMVHHSWTKDDLAILHRNLHVPRANLGEFSDQERDNPTRLSGVDHVLLRHNPVLAAALAQSFQREPTPDFNVNHHPAYKLTIPDIVQFMKFNNGTPVGIMNAVVFGPYRPQYWIESGGINGRLERKRVNTGHISMHSRLKVLETVHDVRHFEDKYDGKEALDAKELAEMEWLVPPHKKDGEKTMKVPMDVYSCLVPGMHNDLGFLIALADCPHKEVFEMEVCEAILQLKWRRQKAFAIIRTTIAILEALNLTCINVVSGQFWVQVEFNGGDEDDRMEFREERRDQFNNLLKVFAIFASVVIGISLFWQVCRAVGLYIVGHGYKYISDRTVWLDLLVILATAYLLGDILVEEIEGLRNPSFATVMGMVVFVKWIRILVNLSTFRPIGIAVLPIIETIFDIGPFLFVLLMFMLGATNMYYALNLYSIENAFILVYRAVTLGDVNLLEWERVPAEFAEAEIVNGSNPVLEVTPEATANFYIVRLFMVIITFLLGLSLMNLFIAMLTVSYGVSFEAAEKTYQRFRFHMVIGEEAIQNSMQRIYRGGSVMLSDECLWYSVRRCERG